VLDLHPPQLVAAATRVGVEVEPGAHHREACIPAGIAAAAADDVRHLPGRGVGRLVHPQLPAAAARVGVEVEPGAHHREACKPAGIAADAAVGADVRHLPCR